MIFSTLFCEAYWLSLEIINNCVAPEYKPMLREYLSLCKKRTYNTTSYLHSECTVSLPKQAQCSTLNGKSFFNAMKHITRQRGCLTSFVRHLSCYINIYLWISLYRRDKIIPLSSSLFSIRIDESLICVI